MTPFGKKRSKTGKIQFSTVFVQKGGHMFDLNFVTRFEIISSFAAFMALFVMILKF